MPKGGFEEAMMGMPVSESVVGLGEVLVTSENGLTVLRSDEIRKVVVGLFNNGGLP